MIARTIVLVLTVGANLMGFNSLAQSSYDLRINEVMLINTSNYEDSYGQRSAWIEIFNRAYNRVNLAGCFLTDDLSNPQKYRIPGGDPSTIIPQRQFQIFWADDKTEHGTFHLNFILDSTNRFIALIAADGRTLIDSLTIPMSAENQSYSRTSDGEEGWAFATKTTPNTTNNIGPQVSAGDKFRQFDPIGISMVVIAMVVVFTALMLLYRVFRLVGRLNMLLSRKRSSQVKSKPAEGISPRDEEISGEVFAAISTALYLYETENHDYESAIVTIQRVSKTYSPWSSKIYGLRHVPEVSHQAKTKKR